MSTEIVDHSSDNIMEKSDMPKGTSHVLVIDDEHVVRQVCQLSLERAGFQVAVAKDGISGLGILDKRADIDIVLTDLKMPGMNGMDVLRQIKVDKPHVEVIIMTGYATIERAITAMKIGAYDFILKPLKPDQIRLAVKKCEDKIALSKENRELLDMNRKLRELQDMKERFMAITSHELRTPVSHLKGFLSIVNDEIFHQLDDRERQECTQIIDNAVNDLEEIVNNMFDIFKLKSRSMVLRADPVDMGLLLQQVVTEHKWAMKGEGKRELTLELLIKSKIPLIQADRIKLKTLFSQLVQNAIKYTEDGGRITVVAHEEDGYCVVAVRDTGIGISHEEKARIFDTFYESQNPDYHSTSKYKFMGGGIGLGLTLAREIAKAHGGTIRVESEPGQGAEFLVYLPIKM